MMAPTHTVRLKALEGRWVSIALANGARIDDCQLVSVGRHRSNSVWLFANGADTFVPADAVVDVWEA